MLSDRNPAAVGQYRPDSIPQASLSLCIGDVKLLRQESGISCQVYISVDGLYQPELVIGTKPRFLASECKIVVGISHFTDIAHPASYELTHQIILT